MKNTDGEGVTPQLIIRTILKYAVIALFIFLGAKFIWSFKKEPVLNELQENIRLVEIKKVNLSEYALSVPVYGHLKSLDEIELFPEVGGVLKSETFREGKSFSKGEIIASIENDELKNNIRSQKSNFLNQVAKLVSDLKFDFPDAVSVWEKFLEEISFDKSLPTLPDVNDTKLKKYLAGKNIYNQYFAIQSQEDRLAKYYITAPFDGVLVEAIIKPGTVVRMGQKIGKFINPTQFELEANVSINDGKKIKVGDVVEFSSNDLNGSWQGKVARINSVLSETSQNMDVFIQLNSSELFSGMYLFGNVMTKGIDNATEIKRSLLRENEIFIIQDGKLALKEIQIVQIDEEIAIIQGVEEGDVILAEPVKGGYEGMKVRFNNN